MFGRVALRCGCFDLFCLALIPRDGGRVRLRSEDLSFTRIKTWLIDLSSLRCRCKVAKGNHWHLSHDDLELSLIDETCRFRKSCDQVRVWSWLAGS